VEVTITDASEYDLVGTAQDQKIEPHRHRGHRVH
jgi:hypothetical protein